MLKYSYIGILLFACSMSRAQGQEFELTPAGAYNTIYAVPGWTVENATNSSPGALCTAPVNWLPGSPEFSVISSAVPGTAWNNVFGQFSIDNVTVPLSPLGGQHVVRLHDNIGNGMVTRLRKTFQVTPANYQLAYAFCGSWADGSHPCCNQSGLRIRMLDCLGNPINCGSIYVTAVGGFCSSALTNILPSITGGVTWTNWQTNYVGLFPYIGSCVTLEVMTADCSLDNHHGCVYFDATTGSGNTVYPFVPLPSLHMGYCQGANQAQIPGPLGFAAYQWYAPGNIAIGPGSGGNTPVVNISNPVAGSIYRLEMTTASGCNYTWIDTLQYTTVSITGIGTNSSCPGGASGSASVQGSGSGTGYNYNWYGPGNPNAISTASYASNLAPGVYTVGVSAIGAAGCGSVTATLTVNPLPSNFYTLIKAFCGNTAYLTTPMPGTNFKWYNANTPIPANQGGTGASYIASPVINGAAFTVTYVTSQGCADSVKYLLAQVPPGSFNVLSSQTACQNLNNGMAVLSITPAANAPPGSSSFSVLNLPGLSTFSLSPNPNPGNTFTLNNLPFNSTYSINAYDGACIYTSTFAVASYSFDFNLNIASATLCPGNSTLATVNFTNPISPAQYTYSWSPATWIVGGQGSTNNVAVVITPNSPLNAIVNTTYSITITPSVAPNCPLTKTISITSSSLQPAYISSITPLCNTSPSKTISVVPGGGILSTGSGNWLNVSTGVITPSLAPIGTNTFAYVISTNTCLVSATGSFMVSQFNSAALTTTSLINTCSMSPCINLMNYVQNNGGVWSGINVTANTYCPQGLLPGFYTLTYYTPSTPVSFACPDTRTTTVQLNQFNSAAVTTSVMSVCAGAPPLNLMTLVTSTALGGWTGVNVQNNAFSPALATGNYSLYYTAYSMPNPTVCPDTKTVVVSVSNPATPTLVPGSYCSTDLPFQLNVSPNTGSFTPSSYVTAGGLFTPSLCAIGNNTVQYTVGTATCNVKSTSGITVNSTPTLNVLGNSTICKGENSMFTVAGASSYLWSDNSVGPVITLNPLITTIYTVTGSIYNCSASKTVTVNIAPCTGINEYSTGGSIKLYPNPANSDIILETELPSSIFIHDALGRLVFTESFPGLKNKINLSTFPDGVYNVRVMDAKKESVLRFIKTSD